MSKDMKVNLAILVSFLTIIATVIAGGIAFGSLQEGLRAQDAKVAYMQERAASTDDKLYSINEKMTEIKTDLKWVRGALEPKE